MTVAASTLSLWRLVVFNLDRSSGVRPPAVPPLATKRHSVHIDSVARVTFCNTVSLQRNAPPPSTIGLLRLVIELTAVGFGPGMDTREEGGSAAHARGTGRKFSGPGLQPGGGSRRRRPREPGLLDNLGQFLAGQFTDPAGPEEAPEACPSK